MYNHKIKIIETRYGKAVVYRFFRRRVRLIFGADFTRDENLVAPKAALFYSVADALFVFVSLCGIDKSVTRFNGVYYGIFCLFVGHDPCA